MIRGVKMMMTMMMMMEQFWVFALLWMLLFRGITSEQAFAVNNVKAATDSNLVKPESGVQAGAAASSSVLVALLDSPYTEWIELLERTGLLESLEKVVGTTNITIFAPTNTFLDQHLDPELKSFLLEPGNAGELTRVLQYHIVPQRIRASNWDNVRLQALSADGLHLHYHDRKLRVELATIAAPDSIISTDGVVHGIHGLLVPSSVQYAFANKKNGGIPNAVIPQGAPELDPAIAQLPQVKSDLINFLHLAPYPSPLAFAPAPDFAPAPAPGPSAAHHHLYGDEDVADFVYALANYGGYSEIAELLVNLTSFAWDMAKLVNEGHRLTVLAPNNHAVNHLTAEQLSAPGGIEALLMYHVLSEYQTEESLYESVRRLGKVAYSTLHVPLKVTAREADGTVQFGEGEHSAIIYDQDIFTDGRISIQGINKVLVFPKALGEGPSADP